MSPEKAAVSGIALTWVAWLVLVFGGFGGERTACPGSPHPLVTALAVLCPLVASAGFVLAIWSYRASAERPSGQWLLGAAGLYVAVLGWAAAVTGGIALLLVDLCELV
jgi:hypothetical protein